MSAKPTVRLARVDDLARINDIYNHYVESSTCTYQETPETMTSREAWLAAHGPAYPVTVADVDGEVAGWGSLSPFHARSAYRFSVENSVYVAPTFHRQGLGGLILGDLIVRAETLGYRTIIAGIDADQPASVALHAKFDFELVARLAHVGFKFDRWLDVIYMQRML